MVGVIQSQWNSSNPLSTPPIIGAFEYEREQRRDNRKASRVHHGMPQGSQLSGRCAVAGMVKASAEEKGERLNHGTRDEALL